MKPHGFQAISFFSQKRKPESLPAFGKEYGLSCFSVALVDDADVHLFVRELDLRFVEALLRLLADVEEDVPVVGVFAPRTAADHDTVVGGTDDTDGAARILQNLFVAVDDIVQDLLGDLEVLLLGDLEFEIDTAELLLGVIHDVGTGSGTVRNVNDFVIEGNDLGVAEADLLDRTGGAGDLDEVVNAEGAGDEDQHAACDIAERAVDSRTDADAEGGDQSGDGAGVNAEEPDVSRTVFSPYFAQ